MLSACSTGWCPVPWPLLGSSDPSCTSSSWPSLPPHSPGSLSSSPHLLIVCGTVGCLWGQGCTCPCACMPSFHLPTLQQYRPQLLLSGPGWPGTGSCKVPGKEEFVNQSYKGLPGKDGLHLLLEFPDFPEG